MHGIFLFLLNMSISACPLILAVILLRFVLTKAPKSIRLILWAMVGIRLLCPITVESVFSLALPSDTVSSGYVSVQTANDEGKTDIGNAVINVPNDSVAYYAPAFSEPTAPVHQYSDDTYTTAQPEKAESAAASSAPVHSRNGIPTALAYFWLAGLAAIGAYAIWSYLALKKRADARIRLRDNIYVSDDIESPFVMGFVRPVVIVPSGTENRQLEYIEAHEKAHIARGDHLWKPLGFALLAVYWFNPLAWLSYVLFCRDIEYACDERVVRAMDISAKQEYMRTLLQYSTNSRGMAVCPVAFGEVGVKERVREVMNYKKPKLWIMTVAVIACIIAAVCFLTSPIADNNKAKAITDSRQTVQENSSGEANCPYSMVFGQAPHDDLIWLGHDYPSDWGYINSDGILFEYYYRDGRTKKPETVSKLYDLLNPEQYEYIGEGSYDIIGTDGEYPEDLCVRFADENGEYLNWFYLDGEGDLLYVVASRSGEEYEEALQEYLYYKQQGLPAHEPEPVFAPPQQYKAPAELYETVRAIILSLPETKKYATYKMVDGVNSYFDDTGAMFSEYEIESPAIARIVIHSDLHLISEDCGCDFTISRNSYELFYSIIWPAFCDLDCIETIEPQYEAENNDTHTIYLYASDFYDTPERDNHVIVLFGDSGIVKVNLNGEIYWYDGGEQMINFCQRIIGYFKSADVAGTNTDPQNMKADPLLVSDVPDMKYPKDGDYLTLHQALHCVSSAGEMIRGWAEASNGGDVSEEIYCWPYAGYEAGECTYFGDGTPCENWKNEPRSYSLVFHNDSSRESFLGGEPRPAWLISVYDPASEDKYTEIIYVDAQTGDMYNSSKRGGYMPSPYTERSEYSRIYFAEVYKE